MTELSQRSLLARRGARMDAERQLISSLARRRRRGDAKRGRSGVIPRFFFRQSINLKTGENFPVTDLLPFGNREKSWKMVEST